MNSVLIIEDRESLRQLYASFLRKKGYLVSEAGSAEEGEKALGQHEFGLVLTDFMLPGANGIELLKKLKSQDPETCVVVMTAFGEIKLAVEAMKHGAADFLEKPIDLDHLELVVGRAFEHRQLVRHSTLTKNHNHQPRLVLVSDALKTVAAMSDKVACSDATCLLLGESGVGKELFASRIHQKSNRKDQPLISVNCAAIPRELMESELFGHEKGAFTGAVGKKSGLMEMADGGTLFLDEIGELPLDLQPKLLRAIQTGEFRRVGGTKLLKCQIRFICATNRDLSKGVQEGWFREDLYYRVAVFPIEIPPLRERKEDILPIAEEILQASRYLHLPLSEPLCRQLEAYSWPGNVRELKNILERALILAGGNPILADYLPEVSDSALAGCEVRFVMDANHSLRQNLENLQVSATKQLIRFHLERSNGHRTQAAQKLGVSVKTLYNKMQEFDLG